MIAPALRLAFIENTAPASPHSPKQKYRLTEKGRAFLEQCK
jgi:predicted transcriptional regulator